jgi:hypothetical protein
MKTRAQERYDSSVALPIVKNRQHLPEKALRSESWPQQKHHKREETKRQQCFEALFTDPQHGERPNNNSLQQFLSPIIERKSFRGVDARLTKARF